MSNLLHSQSPGGGCRNGHGGRSLCFGASQYRWVRRQKALQSEAWVKCCFGCIKQKGTTPDLAPYDDEPRPLRHLRSEIAALRATLPDRPTGTTPRGLPAGTASPIPPAKHRGPGRLGSRKEGERPPRVVPFSRDGGDRGGSGRRGAGGDRAARPGLATTTASEIGDAIAGDKPSPRPLPGAGKMVTEPANRGASGGMRTYFEREK